MAEMHRSIKLTVGKGLTTRSTPAEEWARQYYELETTVQDPSNLEAARANLVRTIDGWLGQDQSETPSLDPSKLDGLPWLSYRTKTAARSGDSAWTKNPQFFKDARDDATADLALALANALKAAGGKLQLGDYEYALSGLDGRFIGRRPLHQSTQTRALPHPVEQRM